MNALASSLSDCPVQGSAICIRCSVSAEWTCHSNAHWRTALLLNGLFRGAVLASAIFWPGWKCHSICIRGRSVRLHLTAGCLLKWHFCVSASCVPLCPPECWNATPRTLEDVQYIYTRQLCIRKACCRGIVFVRQLFFFW